MQAEKTELGVCGSLPSDPANDSRSKWIQDHMAPTPGPTAV